MSDNFEHLKNRPEPKRRPKEIAQEILNTKLGIRTPITNGDGMTLTRDNTLADVFEYLKFEERMNTLHEMIDEAEKAGDKSEIKHLSQIKKSFENMEMGLKPHTEEEHKAREEAIAYGEELDEGSALMSAMLAIRKVAGGQPLSGGLLSDRHAIRDGLKTLEDLWEVQQEAYERMCRLTGNSAFREDLGNLAKGVLDSQQSGTPLSPDANEMIEWGAATPDDPNIGEELTINMVKQQMKMETEIALIEQVSAKLGELNGALGRGRSTTD